MSDSGCSGLLKCFTRSSGEAVPGITFGNDFPTDKNVCYDDS